MATVILSPLISSMHGPLGNTVLYHRYNKEYARLRVKGRNPDTEAQKLVRRTFADAVKSWQALSDDEKYKFNRKARHMNMSGYNLYLSGYLKEKYILNRNNPVFIKDSSNISSIQKPVTSVSPPFMLLSRLNIDKGRVRTP